MKLRDFFEENSINVAKFCQKHGIYMYHIYRIYNGRDIKYSEVLKIVAATGGAVTPIDLIPTNPEPQKRVGRPPKAVAVKEQEGITDSDIDKLSVDEKIILAKVLDECKKKGSFDPEDLSEKLRKRLAKFDFKPIIDKATKRKKGRPCKGEKI